MRTPRAQMFSQRHTLVGRSSDLSAKEAPPPAEFPVKSQHFQDEFGGGPDDTHLWLWEGGGRKRLFKFPSIHMGHIHEETRHIEQLLQICVHRKHKITLF